MASAGKSCVYTCLIGRYEKLNEQPVAARSEIPFICLTDDPELASDTWRIVQVERAFPSDSVRSQRMLKLMPYPHLPGFDRSLYIDNAVLLTVPPEQILERYVAPGGLALPIHSFRARVVDEFAEVTATLLDDESRIADQLDHYRSSDPGALEERPYWSGMMIRDHRNAEIRRAMEKWAAHVLRYSRRDQLSANYVFRWAGVTPLPIEIDSYQSWFHHWPVALDRRSDVRIYGRRQADRNGAPAWATVADWLKKPLRAGRRLAGTALRRARAAAPADERREVPSIAAPASYVDTPGRRRIYVDPRDDRARALVKANGDLNPPSLAMWRDLVAAGDWTHIVDVGANYGEMLLAVAPKQHAAITAVEPNLYVIPHLLRTIRESGLTVAVIAGAVSDRTGMIALNVDLDWSGETSVIAGRAGSAQHRIEVHEVEALTLAGLIPDDARGVRFLAKIDVEGHEVAVLRGLGDRLGELADFAALVEVPHLGDDDLDWIVSRFTVALRDLGSGALVTLVLANARNLRELLSSGRYYPQDVVLRRRPAAVTTEA